MREWTEGVCGDGAAIICDGEMVPLTALLKHLNAAEAACDASWRLGHKVYHNANAHEAAPDWTTTRKLLAAALGR